ncbi:MAG: MATE family efflux transporter [Bacteroidales bacterium]|nr:MATE family efflux transporter [Bacteroidales bacterium]
MLDRLRKFTPAYREIIRLGLPILVGQVGMIIVGFADNIMVGRYNTDSLAAASFVNNVFNVAIFCCIGFTYGLTPLAGALFGVGKKRDIGSLTRLAMWINIGFSLLIMALMTILYFNVERLGQPVELMHLIKPYYVLYLCGMLPITVFNVMAQWSYAINNTRLPMWTILVANLLNVIGNYVLIYGHWGAPELGLYGAGLSTLGARILCPAVMLIVFFSSSAYRDYRDGFASQPARPGDSRLLWRTSLPVSLQMTFESGSFSVAAVMVGWLGGIPLAAFQIFLIVGTLGFCIYYSVGSAISVKVANAAGTGDRTGMRHMAWAGYHIILVLMCAASLTFIFFGRTLMSAFTHDAAVLALASTLIFPMVLYQLGDATQITFANALRGTSQVMPMLWIAFVSYIVVGIPATYILCFTAGLGTYGVILSFSVSLFLAAALFFTYFLRSTRQIVR